VRAALATSLLIAASVAGASACVDTQPCVQRGTSTQFTGSASYSGQLTDAHGTITQVYGALPVSVTVDDFTTSNACSGNPVEFTVRLGDACVLWAIANDDSGNASIEIPQTCGVPTTEGVATLALDQGELSINSPSSLDLSGPMSNLGVVEGSGYLQWTFSGQ
jgi:hypothetical protein